MRGLWFYFVRSWLLLNRRRMGHVAADLLTWGRERWQKVMREAKERGFVSVSKSSDGMKKIRTEYRWNIERPKPAPNGASIHQPEKSTDEKVDGRLPRRLNDVAVVKSNDVVKGNEERAPALPATQKKEKKSAVGKSTVFPEDFKPSPENQKLCTQRELVMDTVFKKFRAHAREHGRRSPDWQAAFERWILGEHKFGKADVSPEPDPANDPWEKEKKKIEDYKRRKATAHTGAA